MSKKSFHEMIAERLIQQLKQGTAPWQRPWEPGAPNAFIPMNPFTGKRYKGINAIALMAQDYRDPRWMTYKQAEETQGQVRKGEKGSAIQYWKFTEEQIKKDEQGKPILDAHGKTIKIEIRLERPRVFYATVFNAEQIDGLPPLTQKERIWNSIERAEHILSASGAIILHGENNRAFYRPCTDSIHLPCQSQFLSADNYYATALHELSHWTGHSSRMDRDLIHPFGSEGYAKEELRAEITSMILGDELGIGHDPGQHASYVGSWIKVLHDDPLELFRAAAEAERMQQFILSFELKQEQVEHINSSLSQELENKMALANEVEPVNKNYQLNENPLTLDDEIAMLNKVQSQLQTQAQTNQTPVTSTSAENEKIWLDIPFKQKEVVKELAGILPDGRKAIAWDKEHSRWFAHPGANLEILKPWHISPSPDIDSRAQKKNSSQIATEKTWLVVPYEQREVVKHIAGRLEDGKKAVEWDKAAKCWFAHIGANLEPLKPWLINTIQERQQPALAPEQEFSDVLRSIGSIVTGEHPIMDGKKHRISVEGDKKGVESGFYVGHLDGHPAGYAINNRTGIERKWKSKGYSLTEEERATLHAYAATKIKERAEAQRQDQEDAAQRVSKQLADLVLITTPTPYLQTKKIEPHSEIFTDINGQTTYIPAIDASGKLWTMQYIKEDGTKRFAKNSRKEGCFHALGGLNALAEAPALVIAEGFATAASISQELGFATISAFDSGNLEPVARALQEQFPDKPIIIMGDDDKHLEQTQNANPGKTKALEAANAVQGVALFPVFAPGEQEINPKSFSDFNDLAIKSVLGREGLHRQVNSLVDSIVLKHHLNNKDGIKLSSIEGQKRGLSI
ncbi:zincin-like metallopeptidase domain-containing protein [Legionella pneumophila]|jgi:putative DNA primase/helicase|uniref:zincin-like metallopeptidase domain-containing protein n=1 Tax=Legionella pneumophila TaxID=446 RepID=UPI0002C050DC|nr:zincin-like metallopeptidase domain-containing protein [Legionella pneumophila]AGH55363.1 DNA primase TraC [Legionella pneumophila subsp. pneumophila LPE509]MCW8442385.1 zincin-like metallopeptidase domain-containing protein [Legionella pneumophila]